MRFKQGEAPAAKTKVKTNPLDSDQDFLRLRAKIVNGQFGMYEEAGLYVHDEEDGKRLGVKGAARMVRDHIRRVLRAYQVEQDYKLTLKQTNEPGEWAVWLTYRPKAAKKILEHKDMATSALHGQ
jgi:hypothetical protein